MSDAQTYEEVTVSSNGVIVTKRFEADEFPVPAIAFNVVSKRSEPVTLRLVDTVPEDVAVEDLGFHPEYGSEYWDINEDRIAFEKEVQADSEYTTVYGIRATGTDDVEKFLTEPEIESVDPPLDEDEDGEALVGSGDDAVKDVIAGDADSVPGLEDEDGDEDIETLDLKDPNNPDAPAPEQVSDSEGSDDGDGGGAAETNGEVGDGTVIAAMADEIRNSNVSPDDVKLLQRALDAVADDDASGGSSDGATQAKIERLQGDIADLRAYTDALEEFLDENGTGDEMIEEFSRRLDAFETELNSFESEIENARSTAQSANAGVENLEEEVSVVEDDVEDVESEVDSIGNSLRTVEDDVDEFDDQIEQLDEQLSDVESEIEQVREEMGDGEIDERLNDLESEIVELNEWREQLSSVIGGS